MGGGGDGGNPMKDIMSGTVAGFAQVAVGENQKLATCVLLCLPLRVPQKVHLLCASG